MTRTEADPWLIDERVGVGMGHAVLLGCILKISTGRVAA